MKPYYCRGLLLSCGVLLFSLMVAGPGLADKQAWERLAALQETLVCVNGAAGIPGVFTYHHDPEHWLASIALGKLRAGVVQADGVKWLSDAEDLVTQNIATGEGVETFGTIAGHKVKIEGFPTAVGRDSMKWEGAAVLKVTCSPAAQLVLQFGCFGECRIWLFSESLENRYNYLTNPDTTLANSADLIMTSNPGGGTFETQNLALKSAVTFSSDAKTTVLQEGQWLKCTTQGSAEVAYAMVGFAETTDRSRELAASDAKAMESECRNRFKKLAGSAWIKTPNKTLDAAFEWALFNLEYSWCRPYGWIESPHHWGTFYSLQQSMGADWIGQSDRSKEMLLTHAARLLPSGQVPQLDPSGRARQDFGGWNQFYAWAVQHYWETTGDTDFAERIREPYSRVVDQTITAHDPDHNGLLGFGQQIGNQEDYISTPEDGTSPTIAAIEMKRIQAELARALGRNDEAKECEVAAGRMAQSLRRTLWDADLGRFIFYQDSLGVRHLDGQYHTLIWPVIYRLLNAMDSYTSMRHLADTLTGKDGEIFASNNFPYHVQATLGCQSGGQQQPWATLGWSKLGDGKKAVAPLEWIAGIVMSKVNMGSWPEVTGDFPSYFSPPTGIYIQAMVEGVFGLKLDKPGKVLRISPCIPDDWPKASLHLPEFDLVVTQSPNSRRIECKSKPELRHIYRIAIPPSTSVEVLANGKRVDARLEPGMNCQFVIFDKLAAARSSILDIRWRSIGRIASGWPAEISPMQRFDIKTGGLHVVNVGDPCGVLSESKIEKNMVRARVREGVAAGSEGYGSPGKRILSRRTVFLNVKTDTVISGRPSSDTGYWIPVDFSVAPPKSPITEAAIESITGNGTLTHIPLPESAMLPDTGFLSWRWWSAYGHGPWNALEPPLKGLEGNADVSPACTPGLTFANPDRKVAVVSRQIGQPFLNIPVKHNARRVYLLVLPLLDHQDVFSPVGRISVSCQDRSVFSRTLRFPGDLEWWAPKRIVGELSTVGAGWSRNPTWEAPSSVMNVIEFDMGESRQVDSVTIEAIGRYPALGVVGVTVVE